MIIGVDPGNYEVKIIGPHGEMKFLSNIGEARELKLKNTFGADDMVVEYEGRKLFAGSLAKYESEFGGAIMGDSKAHEDAKMRILMALHKYCNNGETIKLVTGQPIKKHDDDEKNKIKEMLLGRHEITINEKKKHFYIDRVEVAPEGAAAFWSDPKDKMRIIDIGGGTVNMATVNEQKRFIDRDSDTLPTGIESNKTNDLEALSRAIIIKAATLNWETDNAVFVAGGVADKIVPYIQKHFINANVMRPKFRNGDLFKTLHPVFANVVGFYNLGVGIFGK